MELAVTLVFACAALVVIGIVSLLAFRWVSGAMHEREVADLLERDERLSDDEPPPREP